MTQLPRDPSLWGPEAKRIVDLSNLPPIGPDGPTPNKQIPPATLQQKLFAHTPTNNSLAQLAFTAGILLWQNELEASHEVSQNLHQCEGSFWHGIMHRREPDYSNAKYWFAKVGKHPVYEELLSWTQTNLPETATWLGLSQTWDANLLVDGCRQAAKTSHQHHASLQLICAAEALLLLDHCYQQATN